MKNYSYKGYKNIIDPHTHTIASGHAYSTIAENAKEASRKGLELLGITEHAPAMPGAFSAHYFCNLHTVPRELYGVKIMMGAEYNIIDYNGNLDMPEEYISELEIGIASLHPPCLPFGNLEQNTNATIKAMENPCVHIIGHPGDPRYPLDIPEVVRAAKRTNTLLELNDVSLMPNSFRKGSRENIIEMLKFCKKERVSVICASDAHFFSHIGELENCFALLEELDFPAELVLNFDTEAFRSFIAQKSV